MTGIRQRARTRYVLTRVLAAASTVFVAITLNFFLFRVVPGSAVSNLSQVPGATPAVQHALAREFGLDKPTWQQYIIYLDQLGRGNLGLSYDTRQPVAGILGTALANTVPMVALGTLGGLLLGMAAGVVAAWRRATTADYVLTGTAITFFSVPGQWLGLMLLTVFAGTLPTSGRTNQFLVNPSFWHHVGDVLAHMVLPSATLAVAVYGEFTLIVRSAMLETLAEDYVLTARAKGLSDRSVLGRHALRNAMQPTSTVIALSLAYLVTGAILVEIVFSWPGIGLAIYNAVNDRDYPVLQGAFLLLTVSVVLLNLVADLIAFKLDPRIST